MYLLNSGHDFLALATIALTMLLLTYALDLIIKATK